MRRLVLGVVLWIACLAPVNAGNAGSTHGKTPESEQENLLNIFENHRQFENGIPGSVIAALMQNWPKGWNYDDCTARFFASSDDVALENLDGSRTVISLPKGSTKLMTSGLTVSGRHLSMIFIAVTELEKKRAKYELAAYFAEVYEFAGSAPAVGFYDLSVLDIRGAHLGYPGDIPALEVELSRDGKTIVSSTGPQ